VSNLITVQSVAEPLEVDRHEDKAKLRQAHFFGNFP